MARWLVVVVVVVGGDNSDESKNVKTIFWQFGDFHFTATLRPQTQPLVDMTAPCAAWIFQFQMMMLIFKMTAMIIMD